MPSAKQDGSEKSPAFRAAAPGRDVFPDRLSAPTPGKDEIDGCSLERFRWIRHEIDIVDWTSPCGFHGNRTARNSFRTDTGVVVMPLRSSTSLQRILLARLTDADSSPCEGKLCRLQNPLELVVHRLSGFRRMPLRLAGELDG